MCGVPVLREISPLLSPGNSYDWFESLAAKQVLFPCHILTFPASFAVREGQVEIMVLIQHDIFHVLLLKYFMHVLTHLILSTTLWAEYSIIILFYQGANCNREVKWISQGHTAMLGWWGKNSCAAWLSWLSPGSMLLYRMQSVQAWLYVTRSISKHYAWISALALGDISFLYSLTHHHWFCTSYLLGLDDLNL